MLKNKQKKKHDFSSKPISDNGKMLKYRENVYIGRSQIRIYICTYKYLMCSLFNINIHTQNIHSQLYFIEDLQSNSEVWKSNKTKTLQFQSITEDICVFLNMQFSKLSRKAIWRVHMVFTRLLVQKHNAAPGSMGNEKKLPQTKRIGWERLFWSNLRGIQQNRCCLCDEK